MSPLPTPPLPSPIIIPIDRRRNRYGNNRLLAEQAVQTTEPDSGGMHQLLDDKFERQELLLQRHHNEVISALQRQTEACNAQTAAVRDFTETVQKILK